MGKRRQCRTTQRQRRRPLYKCMVKTAMACLKQKPGATRQQIERKVMSIYKKRGLDHSKYKKSIRRAISGLMKTRSIKKCGPRYQIVSACAREEVSVHKRRRSRSQSQSWSCSPRSCSRSRSRSRNRSKSHSRTASQSKSRSRGSNRQCRHIRQRRRRRRPIMHHQRRRGCKLNVTHCPIANAPICARICKPICAPICNPICKFPFRDAMIIAVTILFSYWMQRTASQMQGLRHTSIG